MKPIIFLVLFLLCVSYAEASFTPKEGIVEDSRGWYVWKEFKIGENISYWAIQIVQLKVAQAQEIDLWFGYPKLKRVCSCESNGNPDGEPRQFNKDGTPLWGNNPKTGRPEKKDVGLCQISLPYHGKETKRLGLDVIYSGADNLTYAKILWDKQGAVPWKASSRCHKEN